MKYALQMLQRISLPKTLLLLIVVLLPVLAFGFFFTSQTSTPHASELAFIEYSANDSIVGSVVPASCESVPPMDHFPGDCVAPPQPAYIAADCGAAVNPPNAKTIYYPATARAAYYLVRVDYVGDPAPHLIQNDYYTGTYFNFTPDLGVSYNAWVHACNIGGCSAPTFTTFSCPFPVVVDINVTPTKVDAGDSVTVNWNVSGATSCTASGAWSGAKSITSGSESFNPTADSLYTLQCSGPGGTTVRTATVSVPSGYITTSGPCTIPIDGTSCNVFVSWQAYNFFLDPDITQDGVSFSSSPSGLSIPRPITPDDHIFAIRDTGGSFSRTHTASVSCATGSVWADNRCIRLPDIQVNTDSEVIRSGTTADVEMEITANYELTCTLSDGGTPYVFTHTGSVAPQTYNRTTRRLTSAQVVDLTCVSPLFPVVTGDDQVRINVVPTIQEI